jgi:uracil-DNA glycosylase family 4
MDKKEKLAALKSKAKKDQSLPLKEKATNLVFGVGNPNAEILFIGEGPGYWEDVKAEPFVGNAGALLNQLLQLIDLEREDVYITNVVMYRPPNNRDPEASEIKAFLPYLDGIIEIIDPKIIVTLGRFSMAKFLPGVYISNVHGKSKTVERKGKEIVVVPMYHPAAGLRNSDIKEKLKRDFEKLPGIINELKQKKSVNIDNESKQMTLV